MRTKQNAIKEAETMMNDTGGEWCVVKLGDDYWAVHEKYLEVHGVKAVKKIKNIYAAKKDAWYKRIFIPPIRLLTKLLQWLARQMK